MVEETKNDTVVNDNLMNAVSGLGIIGKAKNPASDFGVPKKLSDGELNNIYLGEGFGKKVVDVYANSMTRKWIKIDGDPDDLLLKYTNKIKTKQAINHALKWSRLYGSCIVLMLIDDGGSLDQPVNVNAIKTIDSLRIIDKTQLSVVSQSDIYDNPEESNYGKIKIYTVSPIQNVKIGTSGMNEYKVHESRILRFDGEVVPNRLMVENDYFGYSVLVPIYNYLRNLATSYEMSSEILHDYVISVISMKNLSNILSAKDGPEKIKRRADVISYCKSVINGIIIDADGESFDKLTTSLAGVTDLIDRFALALAAVTGIPNMLLMGDSASGLNANGDNDLRSWYDSIANEQEEILTEELSKLLGYVLAADDNPLKGKTIDDIDIVYNTLWQIPETEQAENRNKQSQTDQIYINEGVIMPEDIAESRFGGDAYSFETVIKTPVPDDFDIPDDSDSDIPDDSDNPEFDDSVDMDNPDNG